MKKLILIAARGEAKIFEKDGAKDLNWVKTLVNKKGRRRESEFHYDLPGQSYSKFKGAMGPHRLEGKKDHVTTVTIQFAHTIVKALEDRYVHNTYDKAIIFASPKLLGYLKDETKKLTKLVPLEFIPKNLEKANNEEIIAHL